MPEEKSEREENDFESRAAKVISDLEGIVESTNGIGEGTAVLAPVNPNQDINSGISNESEKRLS